MHMAVTGDPAALPVHAGLRQNAAGYMWEPTGAVQALLVYARIIGLAGDMSGDGKDHGPGYLAAARHRNCQLSVLLP